MGNVWKYAIVNSIAPFCPEYVYYIYLYYHGLMHNYEIFAVTRPKLGLARYTIGDRTKELHHGKSHQVKEPRVFKISEFLPTRQRPRLHCGIYFRIR